MGQYAARPRVVKQATCQSRHRGHEKGGVKPCLVPVEAPMEVRPRRPAGPLPTRPGEAMRYVIDPTRSATLLAWRTTISLAVRTDSGLFSQIFSAMRSASFALADLRDLFQS